MKSAIRWGRVLVAAALSELAVIAVLMAVTGVYALASHKSTAAGLQEFGQRAGYYVAPAASGLAVFLGALWVTRGLTAKFLLNGTLVGVAATILTVGMIVSARPEDRFMYIVSFAIRIAAGYLAGLTAQLRFQRTAAPTGSLS
ncbi:MAG TPA: hypothetical protein VMB03_04925 [Bryobacteraceae bacterium]|nr:hypothetical protein [Bryobacteraceae bacterium]